MSHPKKTCWYAAPNLPSWNFTSHDGPGGNYHSVTNPRTWQYSDPCAQPNIVTYLD
jgi:hypothetical protein